MPALPTSKKRRRDRRLHKPPPMRLTERDPKIVEAVYLYRVLRQDQLQALFFGGKSAAQRVLARLYLHGFLARVFVPVLLGRSPTFYVLDKKGADLLRAEMGYEDVSWYPSSRHLKTDFLEHTLALNDVRIALTLAAATLGYTLVTWRGERELKANYDRVSIRTRSGAIQQAPVLPDGYFVLDTPFGRAHFFLEVDRGTETSERFKTKVRAYLAYYASGGYERRFGSKSLRILTVTTGAKRLSNLKVVTEQAGGKRRFWFARLTEISAATILTSAIWQVAGEDTARVLIEQPEGQ